MRKPRWKWPAPRTIAFLVIFGSGVLSFGQVQVEPILPLVMQGLGRSTMPVDGVWQFHEGDNATWASPTLDDSKWQPIRVGEPWEGQGHRGYTGFAWYRRHLVLPSGKSGDWDLALFLPSVDSSCDVYWNGTLVGSLGKTAPEPVWSFPRYRPSGVYSLGRAQSGVLAIRVWKAPIVLLSFPDEGGLISVPQVGSAEAISGLETAARYNRLQGNQFTLAVTLVSSIVGLLALLAWLRNRERRVLLWLALAMFFPLETLIIHTLPFRFGYGLIGVAVPLDDMALWFLLLTFLRLNEHRQLVRWTFIFVCAEIALGLVDATFQIFNLALSHPHVFMVADIGSTIPEEAIELWGLVLVFFAFRQRLDASGWMLTISALLADLVQAAHDFAGLGVRWTHWAPLNPVDAPLVTIAGSPFNIPTIANTLFLVSIIYVAWRFIAEQSRRQSSLEQEFRSAQELQQVLIPEALPGIHGYAVTSAYRPAQEVGGDFFQLLALQDGGALLVIGDVSGKGLPAAMAVALIVGSIRTAAEISDDPATMLTTLNRRLHGRLRGGFATCLALRLNVNGICEIANAGHLPPYLNGEEIVIPPALPLGLAPDAEYESIELRMEGGVQLTVYTDGLLEARDSSGELFGFDRIAALLATRPEAQQIADAAQKFGQEDDITVLSVTRISGLNPVPA